MLRRFAFALLLGAIANSGEPASSPEPTILAMEGRQLAPAEAAELEKLVESNPADLKSRTKLLGYYNGDRFQSPAAAAAHERHVLYVIEHHPGEPVAGLPEVWSFQAGSPAFAEKTKALWLDHIAKSPGDVAILGNAADFFMLQDPDQTIFLLTRLRELDPKNPEWAQKLGHAYQLSTFKKPGMESSMRQFAFREFAAAYELGRHPIEKNQVLHALPRAAYDAKMWAEARKYADLALRAADAEGIVPSTDGDLVHQGNLVLGRLELREGNTEKAKEYLLRAGDVPISPVLGSFGPNMTLAKELLEKGEREAVLQYFDLCAVFWKSGQGELNQWRADVKAGRIPKFGANLTY